MKADLCVVAFRASNGPREKPSADRPVDGTTCINSPPPLAGVGVGGGG